MVQKKFNITLNTLHTKGKPEVVNQKITDSAMVKRKSGQKDNRF
jgi:hypothetical protein